MNILILDNNIFHANSTKSLLKMIKQDLNINICKNINDAIATATQQLIDLFILETKLENHSGFDFAIHLRKHKKYATAWILFVTSDESYELQAYEYIHCFHYFTKPYDPAEFIEIVQNLLHFEIKERRIEEKVSFEYKGNDCNIDTNSILFIEVNYKSLRVVTIYKSYDFNRIPLNNILTKLPKESFVQCHKSFVVNKSQVRSINYIDKKLTLDIGSTKLPIGGKYKANIMNLFSI